MSWQPIDTAPKDGTRVLLCDADGDSHVAGWLVKAGAPDLMIAGDPQYGAWVIWRDENSPTSIVLEEPKAWMPLPDPPSDWKPDGFILPDDGGEAG